MNFTNIRMFEAIGFNSENDNDKFISFLSLSEDILLSFQKKQEALTKEIKWINRKFIGLINELSLLDNDIYKDSLLDMAIAEMEVIKSYNDTIENKAFNFIELVINIDNKVKILNYRKINESLIQSLGQEKYNKLERVAS